MSDRPMRLGNVVVTVLDVAAILVASSMKWDRILAPVLGVDDPLDVPFFVWGLAYLVATLVLLALVRFAAALLRMAPAGRSLLEVPLRNRAWFWLGGSTDPWLSYRFLALLGVIMLVVLSVAAWLLSSRGILPGPGRAGDTLIWMVVAVSAVALAIFGANRLVRRRMVGTSKDMEGPSAS